MTKSLHFIPMGKNVKLTKTHIIQNLSPPSVLFQITCTFVRMIYTNKASKVIQIVWKCLMVSEQQSCKVSQNIWNPPLILNGKTSQISENTHFSNSYSSGGFCPSELYFGHNHLQNRDCKSYPIFVIMFYGFRVAGSQSLKILHWFWMGKHLKSAKIHIT